MEIISVRRVLDMQSINEHPPVVAIEMITYNHEMYIAQAIESVLMQKTSFNFKLIICEDCSTDATAQICQQYHKKYHDKIDLYLNDQNTGIIANAKKLHTISYGSNARYIAILDGDDYWSDPYKLQKQVDFLENNKQYILCFTRGIIENRFSDSETINMLDHQGVEISLVDFIRSNNQITATALFVNNPDFSVPSWFGMVPFGDWAIYLYLMHTYKKSGYCLPDITAVYRIHSAGGHGNFHESKLKLINAYKMHISFYDVIKKELFDGKYNYEINKAISERISIITELFCNENKFINAIGVNVLNILKIQPLNAFIKNIIYISKRYIKYVLIKFNIRNINLMGNKNYSF